MDISASEVEAVVLYGKRRPVGAPISWGEAQHLLSALKGPQAPPSFTGGLPSTDRVGPGPAAATLAATPRSARLCGAILVFQPVGRTSVAFELRFNPVDGFAVAFGSLTTISELREPLQRCLVPIEIEPADEHLDRGVGPRRPRLGRRVCR